MTPKTPPRERRRFLEVRAETTADGKKILTGYAAKFGTWSEDLGGFKETIRAGAFTAAIEECDVRALVDHNPTLILGRNRSGTLRLEEDATGLRYEIDLPDTQAGRDIWISVERKDVTGSSFGFATVEDAWTFDDKGGATRELIKVHLFDVSPVTFPAYVDTEVDVDTGVATRALAELRCACTAQPAPPATPLRDAAARWLRMNVIG